MTDIVPSSNTTSEIEDQAGASGDVSRVVQFEQLKNPDIRAMVESFKTNRVLVEPFINICKRNYDILFCRWAGQSNDQRKHSKDVGAEALPWEGASDAKYFFIQGYKNILTRSAVAALRRMKITANPTNSRFFDIKKANHVSAFMRWLVNMIPDVYKQVEILCSYLIYTGIGVTHHSWKKEIQKLNRYIQLADFPDQIQQLLGVPAESWTTEMEDMAVEIAKGYLEFHEGEYDNEHEDGRQLNSDKQLRDIISCLREEGYANVKVLGTVTDRPVIQALSPYERIIFPAGTIEVQDAPFVDMVEYYSPYELRSLAKPCEQGGEDWDSVFVEKCIERAQARDSMFLQTGVRMDGQIPILDKIRNLVQMIHRYTKVVDKEGNVVIYETIMQPFILDGDGHDCAKHWVPDDALGEYPVVVSKIENYSERLYEVRSLVEILTGTQFNLKAFLDGQIDRVNMTILPPQLRRMNGMDTDEGYVAPMSTMFVRDMDEIKFMDPPAHDVDTESIRSELKLHADLIVGVPNAQIDPSISKLGISDFLDRISDHMRQVFSHIFRLSKRYGSDNVFFRVGGSQEVVQYKHDLFDNFDFTVSLDPTMGDWEQIKGKLQALEQVMSFDTTGIVQRDAAVKIAMNVIDPIWADETIGSPAESQQRSVSETDIQITKALSGLPTDLTEADQKNQTKIQRFMAWAKTPIAAKAMQDPDVGPIVQNLAKQYQFAQQQQQNAQIGRLGATPSGQQNGSQQENVGQ